jgi:hypothetical protein
LSEIRANTVSNAAGTGPATLTGQVALKAALNYNNDTTSIRESFNISSATDQGTGDLSFVFTNSFSTNDWSFSFGGGDNAGTAICVMNLSANSGATPKTASGAGVECNNSSFAVANRNNNCVHVYGDLA